MNYRSHGGIVNCARSVVELIMRYWPHSIDAVKPERASIDGCMPIFFDGQGNVRLLLRLGYQRLSVANRPILRLCSLGTAEGNLLNSERKNVWHPICDVSSYVNSSHSGILVRNDAAKDRLRQRLGDCSIIMSGLMSLRQLFA